MGRCRCRPGCLSWLKPSDDIVITVAGGSLRTHLGDADTTMPAASFGEDVLFDPAEALS